ncbi:hypothetical protein PIB30_073505 [Stylosanthes scabra]|uniref:Uncharacterized protein n=1 Tax=Stylosanthes scabra TaxID=79078 RepID=A0ABU6UPB6_9FABA|nr:hypothetical protein [Stylosanthes scabra]
MAVNKEIWIEFDLLRDKQGKRAKGSLESKKRGKQSYSVKYRVLTPRRHNPRLGVAESQGSSYLIQHPTPRRDAQRLDVDEATRKWSLHQDLNVLGARLGVTM